MNDYQHNIFVVVQVLISKADCPRHAKEEHQDLSNFGTSGAALGNAQRLDLPVSLRPEDAG